MICKRCGSEMPDTQKFCSECGALLDGSDLATDAFEQAEPQTPPVQQTPPPVQSVQKSPSKAPKIVAIVLISLFVLIFIPVIAGAAIMLLFSYMRLNALSYESASMVSAINTLQEDQIRLEIRYESTFDLAEVETYAKTVLGMVKAGADQTTFVRSSEGDRAQVLAEQGFFSDWERKLDAFARKLQAYFR